jgi:hypothetical protein
MSVRWPFISFGRRNFFNAEPDFLRACLDDVQQVSKEVVRALSL